MGVLSLIITLKGIAIPSLKSIFRKEASFHMEQTVREKLLVDYAGDKMHLTNCQTGKQQPVEWLVAVLAGSSCPYVQARPSQQKASFFKLPPGYFDKSLLTLCWAIIGLAVLLRRLEPNKDQGRAQQKAFFANK